MRLEKPLVRNHAPGCANKAERLRAAVRHPAFDLIEQMQTPVRQRRGIRKRQTAATRNFNRRGQIALGVFQAFLFFQRTLGEKTKVGIALINQAAPGPHFVVKELDDHAGRT